MRTQPPLSLDGLIAVASSRHGPEGHHDLPTVGVPPGPDHDHLLDPVAARTWLGPRTEFDVPPGKLSRTDLATLRAVRAAVQALADHRVSDYRARTARLLLGATFRLQPDGGLAPSAPGWAGFCAGLLVPLAALHSARSRLKRCDNPRCGWLFLDDSDNQRRRWCATVCGNRLNVRAHRARRSGASPAARRISGRRATGSGTSPAASPPASA